MQQLLARVPGRALDPARRLVDYWCGPAIDGFAKRTLPDCDVLMALSGSGLSSGRAVQRAGGHYVCDRGSTHMRYQMRILAEEYDLMGIPFAAVHPWALEREEAEYEAADAITVPSRFNVRSFAECGVDPAKVHQIPYGVDLSHFQRTAPRDPNFRVLFVGQLSVRKGIGYLIDAFRLAALSGAKLIMVGPSSAETEILLRGRDLSDIEFTGPVNRQRVAEEMSRASVMVLPSIEEGLALVQGQALACGCPVIATTNTGAEDLFDDGQEGWILPIRNPEAIAAALTRLYRDPELLEKMSAAALHRVLRLGGWASYGRRIIGLFEALHQADRRSTDPNAFGVGAAIP